MIGIDNVWEWGWGDPVSVSVFRFRYDKGNVIRFLSNLMAIQIPGLAVLGADALWETAAVSSFK